MSSVHPMTKRKPLVRIVAIVVTLFAAFHVFAQFLWIAPPSQLRTVIPGDLLTDYQIPLFGQSWSVFAPDPINGDYVFNIRAIVNEGDGDADTTDFIDATHAELSMAQHNLFPPRAANLAVESASKYKNAYDLLNSGQQEIVSFGYYEGKDWKQRFDADLRAAAAGDATAIVNAEAFITEAERVNAYATQAARAAWGDDVVFVQYEIYRQNIVPFAERYNDEAVRPDKQTAPSGWRGLTVIKGQNAGNFADVFKNLPGVTK